MLFTEEELVQMIGALRNHLAVVTPHVRGDYNPIAAQMEKRVETTRGVLKKLLPLMPLPPKQWCTWCSQEVLWDPWAEVWRHRGDILFDIPWDGVAEPVKSDAPKNYNEPRNEFLHHVPTPGGSPSDGVPEEEKPLPWSDPAADPMKDIRQAMQKAYERGAYENRNKDSGLPDPSLTPGFDRLSEEHQAALLKMFGKVQPRFKDFE